MASRTAAVEGPGGAGSAEESAQGRAGKFCGRGGGSGVFPATAVVQHNACAAQELRGRGALAVLRSAEP
ncbi:hypothetical protein [Streptomyces violaceusniger]|uniref:hypothetical protein n=1 Tax=Streptomyces violaceusniger TaxID=68280 RepID=UPI00123709C7|nr:hypothetical protein [Streptomyces violaceusniger]